MRRRIEWAAIATVVTLTWSAPARASDTPPSHQRASTWRTVIIPAPAPATRPALTTASLPPPSSAKPLVGHAHAMQGIASYYWQDQMTATGERFDKTAMTAAHKTLPFGTKVRVTHIASGRSVIVRINDRGPFKPGRVVDLSEAAAKQLGMTAAGLATVKLDVVN